ncbi:hypothetical protein MNV49_006374 [Pseudohyphozyma bogoriensis]|nr:hypothetical protein MNV49_006374 [Pseudohyphozyma bogoriensis]
MAYYSQPYQHQHAQHAPPAASWSPRSERGGPISSRTFEQQEQYRPAYAPRTRSRSPGRRLEDSRERCSSFGGYGAPQNGGRGRQLNGHGREANRSRDRDRRSRSPGRRRNDYSQASSDGFYDQYYQNGNSHANGGFDYRHPGGSLAERLEAARSHNSGSTWRAHEGHLVLPAPRPPSPPPSPIYSYFINLPRPDLYPYLIGTGGTRSQQIQVNAGLKQLRYHKAQPHDRRGLVGELVGTHGAIGQALFAMRMSIQADLSAGHIARAFVGDFEQWTTFDASRLVKKSPHPVNSNNRPLSLQSPPTPAARPRFDTTTYDAHLHRTASLNAPPTRRLSDIASDSFSASKRSAKIRKKNNGDRCYPREDLKSFEAVIEAGEPQQSHGFLAHPKGYVNGRSEERTIQFSCPKLAVCYIIGRKGDTIKDIARRSGACCWIKDKDGGDPAFCATGVAEELDRAVQLAIDCIKNGRGSGREDRGGVDKDGYEPEDGECYEDEEAFREGSPSQKGEAAEKTASDSGEGSATTCWSGDTKRQDDSDLQSDFGPDDEELDYSGDGPEYEYPVVANGYGLGIKSAPASESTAVANGVVRGATPQPQSEESYEGTENGQELKGAESSREKRGREEDDEMVFITVKIRKSELGSWLQGKDGSLSAAVACSRTRDMVELSTLTAKGTGGADTLQSTTFWDLTKLSPICFNFL